MIGTWLLIGCSVVLQAAPEADESLQLEIRRLVRQLDAAALADRQAAEASLLKLGPAILDALPVPTDNIPADRKLRLERIRRTLQEQAARSAAEASWVTLRAEAMPLSKVLAALQEQTGNSIVDFRRRFGQAPDDPPITATFDKTPFWKALDEVLDQAGLTVYPYGPERAIHLVARGDGRARLADRVCYTGPFRIEPLRVVAQRDLREPEGDGLRVTLEVAWEPRLRPIGLSQPMAAVEATDPAGVRLEPADTEAVHEATVADTSTAVELLLPMALPPRRVESIDRLRGSLKAMLPGGVETFRFDKLAEAKEVVKRQAGVTVTLVQTRRNRGLWQVVVRVRFDDAGKALQSHRGWIFANPAYLEDAAGKKIPYDAFETFAQSANEVGIAYGFVLDELSEQVKFVYETPGLIIDTAFDYELRDIKLP